MNCHGGFNAFGEEPIWFSAKTGVIEKPEEDHLMDLLNRPSFYGIPAIFLDDEPRMAMKAAFRAGWVRIKITPKYNSAGIEGDSKPNLRKAIRWIISNRPELLDLQDFWVEISADDGKKSFRLNSENADAFAQRGIVPFGA